jgi:hypothetical protein
MSQVKPSIIFLEVGRRGGKQWLLHEWTVNAIGSSSTVRGWSWTRQMPNSEERLIQELVKQGVLVSSRKDLLEGQEP